MIKGLLFDYGGTIDTPGVHWANVMYDAYVKAGLSVARADFDQVFPKTEKYLALNPIVASDFTFYQVIFAKVQLQFQFLKEMGLQLSDLDIKTVATYCDEYAHGFANRNRAVISSLKEKYKIALVSNFYGNLKAVLKAYQLEDLFTDVIESAVVGVRKPDPTIWKMGVEALGLAPAECVVIGDTYKKDIIPAQAIGCQTVWLHTQTWGEELPKEASKIHQISQLEDLIPYLASL